MGPRGVLLVTSRTVVFHCEVSFYDAVDLTFIYFGDRERQSMNRGGAEREGDAESETGSRLRAVSPEPDAGFEPTDHEIVT